jgi:glycosyltransferase involved in cell wall biosynthesis
MNRLAGRRPLCVQLLPSTFGAGAENQAHHLIAGIGGRDELEIELAYFGAGALHQSFEALGVPLRHVPRGRRFGLLGRAKRLRSAYSGREPELLHTWLLEGNIIGLLAARAWGRTGVVISQRSSWREVTDYRAHALVQRLLIGRADAAISNSNGGVEALAHLGFPRERASIVPNGIPEERVRVSEPREAMRARHGWTGKELIGWVGRASARISLAQKGFATMLDAMAEVRGSRPQASLVAIGLTRKEISEAGFEVPSWLEPIGWVGRPADYLNACDVVAISSRTEGSSNAAGEALMLGLPVVTTECGDHCPAVARAGGKVVEVGNASALATGISEMLDQPPARSRVRELVGEEFSVDAMVEATLSVYRDVLHRRDGGRREP